MVELKKESKATSIKTATFEPPFSEDNPPRLVDRLEISRRYLTQSPSGEYAKRGKVIPEMGSKVLNNLLSEKGWSADSLNRLLVSTSYPYGESPSQQIAQMVGAESAVCWDYYAACSGFLMALYDLYDNRDLINQGERIAVIASEQYSPTVDGINKKVFGDGASGWAITWEEDFKILGCKSQISEDKMGLIKMPKVRLPSYPPQTRNALPIPESESSYVEMDNKTVLAWLQKKGDLDLGLPHPIDLADEMLKQLGHEFNDIDILICHQSSGPALDALESFAKEKGFRGRFPKTVKDFGNTSSDSIPRAYHFANHEKPFTPNTKVCLLSFGAGLAVASALLEVKS